MRAWAGEDGQARQHRALSAGIAAQLMKTLRSAAVKVESAFARGPKAHSAPLTVLALAIAICSDQNRRRRCNVLLAAHAILELYLR